MTERNDPCWCGSQKKFKNCHWPKQGTPSYQEHARLYWKQYHILLKTPEQIAGIRRASKLAAFILDEVCSLAKAGVTTNQLDALAAKLHKEQGAIAAPCSRMVLINPVSEEKKHLSEVTYQCLMKAIQILKPGLPLHAIGDAIASHAEASGCSVVHQFVGHGVGVHFHEEPQILHSRNDNKTLLAAGMTFTIEPMINLGRAEAVIDSRDGWTARTVDNKPSAQWEHTLLITESGHEILTTL